MAVTNLAKKYLVATANASLDEYLNRGKHDHLFKNAEKDVFEQFSKFVRSHMAMPSNDLLNEWWDEAPKATEPASYYFEILRNRYMEMYLQKTVTEANELVAKDLCEDAARLIVNKIMPELMRSHGNRLITMPQAYNLVADNYFKQFKLGDDYGIKLGYPVVDDYGGLVGGDIMSIVGRPAAGKSFLQLRGAHKAWRQGKRPCFISMEMNNLISAQRLIAMDAMLPLNAIKMQHGQGLSDQQMKKLKLGVAPDIHDFFLMDGNLSTTVEDVYNFCRQMKPDVLFLDGAYMLKHPNPRIGRFERVAENCELLKQEIAGNLGIPVVASWQFSREAAKKMNSTSSKPQKVGLEDIGYSDAIGQISSIVLGMMDDEKIDTMIAKTVQILKGRNGETGEFRINWLFNPTLNFDHIVELEVGELKHV